MATAHWLRRKRADLAALALLALGAAWLFRFHLAGKALFIGNSDRLNTMLNILSFYVHALRQGKLSAWNDSMYMGFDSLGLAYTFPNPLALLEALAGERHLFFVAGVGSCVLLTLAGWTAYAFIKDVVGRCYPALIGACLYIFCALTTLKVSQNDMSFAVIVTIPLLMLLLRRTGPSRTVPCFLALSALLTCLLTFMFLQKAAYALLLAGGYALYLAVSRRDWRPVAVPALALLVALGAAFPRIYTVGEEMGLMHRGAPRTFESLYHDLGIPRWTVLRWLDDGLFGRFPAEATERLRNPMNITEGMLLYTSAFTVFVLLWGGLRYLRRRAGRQLVRDGEVTYFLGFLLFSLAVVATKPIHLLLYRAFLSMDFIHARILVAAMLPTCTVVAVILRDFLAEETQGTSLRTRALSFALALAAAALVLLGIRAGVRPWEWAWLDGAALCRNSKVVAAAVARIGWSLLAFVALLVLLRRARKGSLARVTLACALAALPALDAFRGANFRMNGRQNWAGAIPFVGQNPLLAQPVEFNLPSAEAKAAFARRLEQDRYRCVVVRDPEQFPAFCAPHVGQFWGLRLVDGYLSGVPKALAAMPWQDPRAGAGPAPAASATCGLRTISFDRQQGMPWRLLALLNVKYAVVVNNALYRNCVVTPAGRPREASPRDVEILTNPLSVVPREFFTSRVEPVSNPSAAARELVLSRDEPGVNERSLVEGIESPCEFTVAGRIAAHYAGDRIDIDVEPSDAPRFLVLNELFHPRWRAYAGPTELRIFRTNGVMRGLVIPPGATHIRLKFTPFVLSRAAVPFYLGALLLFAAGAGCLARMEARRLTGAQGPSSDE
jgi:hypothetical protein